MGIATRKAGTVVRCPTCGGQVIVPHPGAAQPAEQSLQKVGGVFEQTDFDKVLQGPGGSVPPKAAGSSGNLPAGPLPGVDVEPMSLADGLAVPGGFSFAKFLLVTIVLFVLLGLAFLAGFLVGRSSVA
jgi:hypothetical protein